MEYIEQWNTVSLSILVSSGYMPRSGIDGHMVVLFLVFKGISILSSTVAVSIYIPTNSARGLPFSTPSPAFIVCRLFDNGHSDWCEVISHCSFDLHFSNNEWCWASFHVFVSHLYVFFGEMCVWVFFPFFDWVVFLVLSCMSCLYILEINPLSTDRFFINWATRKAQAYWSG